MNKKIVAILFCIIIFVGLFNLFQEFNYKDSKVSFLEYINGELTFGEEINKSLEDIYDTIQIALNKKEFGNFTYYRNTETNGLIQLVRTLKEEEVLNKSNKINQLNQVFLDKDIHYIFVNMPNKVKDIEKFKNIDFGNAQADLLFQKLDKQVHSIDLRKYNQISNLQENFYRTDHHMNMETVFEIYKILVNEMQAKYDMKISSKYVDINNYRKVIIPNSFFGSKGVNVGENHLEKEDFVLLLPKYDTSFEYKQYSSKGKKLVHNKGKFEEALIDTEILYDDTYINKYNAFIYGDKVKAESIIINNNAENNKKLLVISNSYARSLVPYISQCFYETRFIDPQKERFKGDVLEYVEKYEPDMIITLYHSNDFSGLSYIKVK